jgi:hypothetical protein
MGIELHEYIEREDGSAFITLDLSADARHFLIEKGINALLKESLDKFEQELNNEIRD